MLASDGLHWYLQRGFSHWHICSCRAGDQDVYSVAHDWRVVESVAEHYSQARSSGFEYERSRSYLVYAPDQFEGAHG